MHIGHCLEFDGYGDNQIYHSQHILLFLFNYVLPMIITPVGTTSTVSLGIV